MHSWSWTKSLETRYLTNHFWEFHHIYIFGAVGYEDELIKFWGQKVKGQGHSESTFDEISTLEAFLVRLWNLWTYFDETYHSCLLSRPCDTHHHHHPSLFEQAWINPQQRVRPGCPVMVINVLSLLGGLRGQFIPCQVILGHASPTHPRSALACLGHSVPRSYALSLWLSSLCCALHGLAISFCSHEAHPQCPWYPACPGGMWHWNFQGHGSVQGHTIFLKNSLFDASIPVDDSLMKSMWLINELLAGICVVVLLCRLAFLHFSHRCKMLALVMQIINGD